MSKRKLTSIYVCENCGKSASQTWDKRWRHVQNGRIKVDCFDVKPIKRREYEEQHVGTPTLEGVSEGPADEGTL